MSMVELSATTEPEEPSSPSSMEGGDRRLLLLAAVSQGERTGSRTPKAEEEETSMALELPRRDELTASTDASSKKNAAATTTRDGKAVALPPKKRRRPSEVITPNADPATFTLNKNEDFMMQLHRNGLDQIKIPPLYKSPEESVKRKVSVGTLREVSSSCGSHSNATSRRPAPQTTNKTGELLSATSKIVTGGSSPRQRQIVVPPPSTSLPPPPLGISQDTTNNTAVGGGAAAAMAASLQMRGHDYHQHIMSMSMAGLSVPNRMLLMQQQAAASAGQQQLNNGSMSSLWDDGSSNPLMLPSKKKQTKEIGMNQGGSFKGADVSWPSSSNGGGLSSAPNPNHSLYNMLQGGGAHQQQLQMMQRMQTSSSIPLEKSSDEGPLKKKAMKTKKRKKKDATTSSATSQSASLTTKDGKPVAFPNQELYSQMLRMKSMKNPPQSSSAEELAAVFPNQELYSQMLRMKSVKSPPPAAAAAATAATAPPASSQLNSSLSVKKAAPGFMYQDQEESLTIKNRLLQMERALMREQKQKQVQKYLQLQQLYAQDDDDGTINSRIPPASSAVRQMSLHDPTLLSQDDPNLQIRLSFLDLENRVRAEEHDRIIQSSQRQMSELHKQALHLEEQMKLRELDFLQERKRLVDMQTVKRLRLQADELEKRLMM